jgi:hypothetical protein
MDSGKEQSSLKEPKLNSLGSTDTPAFDYSYSITPQIHKPIVPNNTPLDYRGSLFPGTGSTILKLVQPNLLRRPFRHVFPKLLIHIILAPSNKTITIFVARGYDFREPIHDVLNRVPGVFCIT